MCYVMDIMTNLRQYYSNSHKITKREDISNPFEVIERQTLEVENIDEKNKYLPILFFSQLYTHLHTCQKSDPVGYDRSPMVLVLRHCLRIMSVRTTLYLISSLLWLVLIHVELRNCLVLGTTTFGLLPLCSVMYPI